MFRKECDDGRYCKSRLLICYCDDADKVMLQPNFFGILFISKWGECSDRPCIFGQGAMGVPLPVEYRPCLPD